MKRIIPLLILTLIIFLPFEVKALSVDKNNLTIEKGKSETINLSASLEKEVTEISFTLIYTSNDITASYNIAAGLNDSTPNSSAHKIILSEPKSGTLSLGTIKISVNEEAKDTAGVINIYNAKAITEDGETITLNKQVINVNVGTNETVEETPDENKPKEEETKKEEPKKPSESKQPETQKKEEKKDNENKEKKHLLEQIDSNIVNIKLQDGIYEYTVKVKEDIEELDLKPIVKDTKYKVEISNQKISELVDNQIIIKVKNGEEIQEYKINVKVLKVNEIEIDNSEFESTYKYKSKWIVLIVIMSVTLFVGLLINKKSK